jgi:peptide/nickel transport system substrate-binding protein
VTHADAVDDYTVKFALNSSGGLLPYILSDTPGRMVSPAAFNNPDLGQHSDGTGPFRFVSYTPSAVTFDRNPNYWGKKAAYARLVLNIINTADINTKINAVQTGAVDGIGLGGVKLAQIDQLKATPGLKVEQVNPSVFYFLSFNRATPPFDNPAVRQALGYALDRGALAKALNVQATDEIALIGSRYVNDKYKNYYNYDPAKAKKMLADAGYPNGFTTEIGTATYFPDLSQIVQANLAAVGVRTTLHPVDSAPAIIALCYTGQKCPIFVGAAIERLDPTRLAEELFLPDALQNMGHTAPPEVLRKLALAEQPTSDSEHVARVRDLVAQIVVDAPNQVVADVTSYVVYRANISGLTNGWDITGFPDYGQVVKSK